MKLSASFVAALLTFAVGLSTAQAQSTVYWDINGTDPGAGNVGGFTDGVWGTDSFWSLDPDGLAATGAWVAGDHAVFSAGNDAVDSFIDITGTQVAGSMTVEEGIVFLASGILNTGAGNVTVESGATLRIESILRFDATVTGRVVLNGGTLWQSNPGFAGSFLRNTQSLEINGTGTIDRTAQNTDNSEPAEPPARRINIYTPINGNAIIGTGGTPETGGAGTLIKTGPDEFRYQGTGLPLTSFAKLVVEEGLYRLGFNSSTQDERGFGAAPLAVLPDAITLNGGSIAHSFVGTTMHANRGITIGANGGAWAGGTITVPGPISGAGTFAVTGGAVILTNAGNSGTFSGKLNASGGLLAVGIESALGAAPGAAVADQITLGATLPAATTGTLRIDSTMTLDANRGITLAGIGRINIPTGGNTLTYDGVITGPGKFIKMGDGTLTTTSAHSYGGGTDVYGRLVVNNASGSGTGTGAVAVKTTAAGLGTNGTLAGTGSVAGLVTVESAGTIAPGSGGIGTLTAAGGLTLGAGSILSMELGAPGVSDLINVTSAGGLTLDGGSVNLIDAGGLANGNYTLIDYAGALGGSFSNLVLGTTPAGFDYALIDTGSSIDLTVSSVSAALIGDYNNDGTVNAADYAVWRDNNGGTAVLPNDETPGTVDVSDYNAWRANFGDTAGSGAGSGAVPEPSTIALALLSVVAMLGAARKRG
ncbi:MAG: hypothetical protein WD851_08170 [Pirellulales bacterium]